MRVMAGIMILLGIVLAIILSLFEFSGEVKVILYSIIAGIIVFIVTSELAYSGPSSKTDKNLTEEKIRKKKIRVNIIGIIAMIVFSLLFFNFYLYLKAMLGNDLILSLDVAEDKIYIQNGEPINIDIKAKALINPFCSADCYLMINDLGTGEEVFSEHSYIKLPSPLLKHYTINPNEDKFGEKLYKISLECKSFDSNFCYYRYPVKYRTKIISVEHTLNEYQLLDKSYLKESVELLNKEFYFIQNKLKYLSPYYSDLYLPNLEKEYFSINDSLYDIGLNLNILNKLYSLQEYSNLKNEMPFVANKVNNLTNNFYKFNISFYGNISDYNLLIENINELYMSSLYLEEHSFTSYSIDYGRSFINNFNKFILDMHEKEILEDKLAKFHLIKEEFDNLSLILGNEINNNLENISLNISLIPMGLQKIVIFEGNYVDSFILEEPLPICCLYGECNACIDSSSSNYPIIFIHGHSFNEQLSTELSMESFGDMAKMLEKDEGYLDVGYLYKKSYDEDLRGYLGKINAPVLVEATYYIDTLNEEGNSFVFDSKWESIDTYSSRLNDIISNVKYLTGKDKVVLVAHSMGGLVTRNYVNKYGAESLEKIIFIGIPHKGVDGFVINYCSVFGADLECSEMDKSSEFISEVNSFSLPDIPIYNIVGIGCYWEGSDGDGIVKSSSAYLEGAKNIYVNGTCSGTDFFHVRMIKPTSHPEIYKIVKDLIKEQSI